MNPNEPPGIADLERILARRIRAAGLTAPAEALPRLATHLSLMLRWSRAVNLTAIVDPDEAIRLHVIESIRAAAHVRPAAGALLDIGSGNGYPALAIKCVHPALPATLLEPSMRKSVFIESVVRAAGLENVSVRRDRIETPEDLLGFGAVGNISMRAVAVVETVIEGSVRALPAGGRLILLLGGEKAAETLRSLPAGLRSVADEPLPGRRDARLLVLESVSGRA